MSDEPAAAPAGEEPAAEAAAAAPAEPAAPDAAAETPAAAAAETGAEPAEAGAFGSTGPAEPAAAEAKQGDKPEGGKGGKSGKSASKSPTKARLAYYSSSCVAHNSLHWRRTRHRPFAVAAATARNVACSYTHPHVHTSTLPLMHYTPRSASHHPPKPQQYPPSRRPSPSRRCRARARSRCLPWPCPSSAPVPPQGAPGGSGQLGTPRARLGRLGRSQPPPRVPEPAASKVAHVTAYGHSGGVGAGRDAECSGRDAAEARPRLRYPDGRGGGGGQGP